MPSEVAHRIKLEKNATEQSMCGWIQLLRTELDRLDYALLHDFSSDPVDLKKLEHINQLIERRQQQAQFVALVGDLEEIRN